MGSYTLSIEAIWTEAETSPNPYNFFMKAFSTLNDSEKSFLISMVQDLDHMEQTNQILSDPNKLKQFLPAFLKPYEQNHIFKQSRMCANFKKLIDNKLSCDDSEKIRAKYLLNEMCLAVRTALIHTGN